MTTPLSEAIARAKADLETVVNNDQVQRELAESKRRADAEHAAQWRSNLQHYAPVVGWESAWSARATEAVEYVREWMRGDYGDKHLALFGPVGNGKTVAACVWVKSLVAPGCKGNPVVWLRPDDLVSAVCHAYDPASPRLARNVVLDELGEEKREDFVHAFSKFLDRTGHRLLITSNLTRAEFKARYSREPKLVSRLEHLAQAFFLGGESLRERTGGFL
jgi:DNA replication protein DnaC